MSRIGDWLQSITLGSSSASWVLKNLPFVLFLGFLATIYIANAHYAERTIKEIQSLQQDLKKLRLDYYSLKSEIMYNTKQSEISKQIKEEGLKLQNRKKKLIVPE